MSELEHLRAEVKRLEAENLAMKQLVIQSGSSVSGAEVNDIPSLSEKSLSIIVIGASGDLAKKKTFPALFALFRSGYLPKHANIVGFARSALSPSQFKEKVLVKIGGDSDQQRNEFYNMCSYIHGAYDSDKSFANLNKHLKSLEKNPAGANRMFYFAIPPSVFAECGKSIKHSAMSTSGWNRVIVEKPFGRDSESSAKLSRILSNFFSEDRIYRIDHYLGKEMVQNLMVLRFANTLLEPLWSCHNIACVTITFKEDIGTQGRGGYFDNYGIIRDIMQNHLFQILTLVAMDPPVTLSAEDIRNEKVKVLRAIEPITLDRVVLGQYSASEDGKEPGYLEDPGVPKDSVCPTFAQAVFYINNGRWAGVPFILKCGKGLDQRKAEVRVQFKKLPGQLFQTERNELVMRIQPDEAIYWKIHTKSPGLSSDLQHVELDLTYKSRFGVQALPDAYERLILDCLRGDHNLFVRSDELVAAWHIFTPLLHRIEKERIQPIIYPFGSRGPPQADVQAERFGFVKSSSYVWSPKL